MCRGSNFPATAGLLVRSVAMTPQIAGPQVILWKEIPAKCSLLARTVDEISTSLHEASRAGIQGETRRSKRKPDGGNRERPQSPDPAVRAENPGFALKTPESRQRGRVPCHNLQSPVKFAGRCKRS